MGIMRDWLKTIGFITLMALSFMVGLKLNIAKQTTKADTDTIVIRKDTVMHDTITLSQPVPVDRIITDTLYKTICDTIIVSLPIEQKHYEDSLYEAWISGYEARLDSIRIHTRTRYIYNTKTIQPKRPKVVVSAGIYGGVGIRSPDVGVGISVGIPLWWW